MKTNKKNNKNSEIKKLIKIQQYENFKTAIEKQLSDPLIQEKINDPDSDIIEKLNALNSARLQKHKERMSETGELNQNTAPTRNEMISLEQLQRNKPNAPLRFPNQYFEFKRNTGPLKSSSSSNLTEYTTLPLAPEPSTKVRNSGYTSEVLSTHNSSSSFNSVV